MNLRKHSIPLLILLLAAVIFPIQALASPINFNQGSTFSEDVVNWTTNINSYAPTVSFLFSAIFVLMFLFGVVRLGYSIITKTGQVMKGSTGLLIWVPIAFFLIRLFLILLFTINSTNVTLIASDMIRLIRTTGYFTVLGMVLIGFAMFLFFKFLKHPEFGRWSKRLWVVAALLFVLTSIMPIVFGAA